MPEGFWGGVGKVCSSAPRGIGGSLKRNFIHKWLAIALLVLVGVRAGIASVDLEWRPREHRTTPGQTVAFGLYAVANGGTNEPVGAIDAVLEWNPGIVVLTGRTNNGPYRWFSSGFLNDAQLDGLNATWADGNAFYTALSAIPPQAPAQATPEGLLVATFGFMADGAGATEVHLPEGFGEFSASRVHSADMPGTFLTGRLGAARIVVSACGVESDLDSDCDVDLADFEPFPGCLSGPDTPVPPGPASSCDVNQDGRSDLLDFVRFSAEFTGSN